MSGARFSKLILIVALAIPFGRTQAGQPSDAVQGTVQAVSIAEQLPGVWRLVSIETIRASGEVVYPFYGKHPEGMLLYDRSGWMSVQIVSDPKPTVPAASSREGFLASKPAEKVIAIDGYYAYCGTWSVDASASTVTHHIQQSLDPGEVGDDVRRKVSIEGNRLTLIAKTHEAGEDRQRRLVWERAPAALSH
jgi:hypothetical protein